MAERKNESAAYRLGKRLRAQAAEAGALDEDGNVPPEMVVLAVTALLDGLRLEPGHAAAVLAAIGIEIDGEEHVDTVQHVLAMRDEHDRNPDPMTLN